MAGEQGRQVIVEAAIQEAHVSSTAPHGAIRPMHAILLGTKVGRLGGAARSLLLAETMRPLRFALTGVLAALVQLTLLALLLRHGWHSLVANPVAFLVSAQFNFALSTWFTWRDRPGRRGVARRWLAFHGAIAGFALVNMAVFALARTAVHDLAASALGIAVAAAGNFILGDRVVFRSHAAAGDRADPLREEPAA